MLFLILCIGTVVLFVSKKKKAARSAELMRQQKEEDRRRALEEEKRFRKEVQKQENEDGKLLKSLEFPYIRGYSLQYSYKFVEIADRRHYARSNRMVTGCLLSGWREPENVHDSHAVALYAGEQKVGYIHKGRMQDMANEFLVNDGHVVGIVELDDMEDACMRLGFYRIIPYDPYDR